MSVTQLDPYSYVWKLSKEYCESASEYGHDSVFSDIVTPDSPGTPFGFSLDPSLPWKKNSKPVFRLHSLHTGFEPIFTCMKVIIGITAPDFTDEYALGIITGSMSDEDAFIHVDEVYAEETAFETLEGFMFQVLAKDFAVTWSRVMELLGTDLQLTVLFSFVGSPRCPSANVTQIHPSFPNNGKWECCKSVPTLLSGDIPARITELENGDTLATMRVDAQLVSGGSGVISQKFLLHGLPFRLIVTEASEHVIFMILPDIRNSNRILMSYKLSCIVRPKPVIAVEEKKVRKRTEQEVVATDALSNYRKKKVDPVMVLPEYADPNVLFTDSTVASELVNWTFLGNQHETAFGLPITDHYSNLIPASGETTEFEVVFSVLIKYMAPSLAPSVALSSRHSFRGSVFALCQNGEVDLPLMHMEPILRHISLEPSVKSIIHLKYTYSEQNGFHVLLADDKVEGLVPSTRTKRSRYTTADNFILSFQNELDDFRCERVAVSAPLYFSFKKIGESEYKVDLLSCFLPWPESHKPIILTVDSDTPPTTYLAKAHLDTTSNTLHFDDTKACLRDIGQPAGLSSLKIPLGHVEDEREINPGFRDLAIVIESTDETSYKLSIQELSGISLTAKMSRVVGAKTIKKKLPVLIRTELKSRSGEMISAHNYKIKLKFTFSEDMHMIKLSSHDLNFKFNKKEFEDTQYSIKWTIPSAKN